MKVATFNLYQFVETGYWWYTRHPDNTYTPKTWKRKQQWVKQQLLVMDADIIGFQEVFSISALKTLCTEAGYPYFATVDAPRTHENDQRIFISSVVGLASRYPIETTLGVEVPPEARADLALDKDFRFSRLPLYAQIQTPQFNNIHVYVIHLKSKRPITKPIQYTEEHTWLERSRDTLMRLSRGNVASLAQRGAEASLIYHAACQTLKQNDYEPLLVIGDFNDEPHSEIMATLTMKQRIHYIGGIGSEEWPEPVKHYLHDHRLTDSFQIAANTRQQVRPFTHIHHGRGSCLDHILVSNQLNPHNPDAQGEIIHYGIWSEHLNQDGTDNQLQSDHATVCIDCIPTRQPRSVAQTTRHLKSNEIHSRQDFIDLAGGVFQSAVQFRQWSSKDKWEQFWSFFFDTEHGWVRSVYGHTPVNELYQKKRHSIEHIIPRDFLERYLIRKRVPRQVRYGASINPFNLAPSERHLNAKRSNFPFDLDNDRIIRPKHLKLNPQHFAPAGLDADREWVIPSHNRGDIARSLLYMLLLYGIDELYNEHLETLIHWAKVDSPSRWEIAYNQWIQGRLGICNPFIDEPKKARNLLDNKELMYSLQTLS